MKEILQAEKADDDGNFRLVPHRSKRRKTASTPIIANIDIADTEDENFAPSTEVESESDAEPDKSDEAMITNEEVCTAIFYSKSTANNLYVVVGCGFTFKNCSSDFAPYCKD